MERTRIVGDILWVQLHNCLNYQSIEETRMVGDFFVSSKKFNPAKLLELSINRGNNDHMWILHEFEVKSSELLVLPIMERRHIIRWRIFHEYEVLEPKPNCLNYRVIEGTRIISWVWVSSIQPNCTNCWVIERTRIIGVHFMGSG